MHLAIPIIMTPSRYSGSLNKTNQASPNIKNGQMIQFAINEYIMGLLISGFLIYDHNISHSTRNSGGNIITIIPITNGIDTPTKVVLVEESKYFLAPLQYSETTSPTTMDEIIVKGSILSVHDRFFKIDDHMVEEFLFCTEAILYFWIIYLKDENVSGSVIISCY